MKNKTALQQAIEMLHRWNRCNHVDDAVFEAMQDLLELDRSQINEAYLQGMQDFFNNKVLDMDYYTEKYGEL